MNELHTTSIGDHGPPIVLCHGLFGQGRNWTGVAKALGSDHRVLLVDLPHHGRSPWADHFDYLEIADEVAGLLSEDDPVTLVGHSMGGKVAMVLALRHPALVARLCVVDVSPVDYGSRGEFDRFIGAMKALDVASLERRAEADEALAEAVPSRAIRGFLLQNLRREDDHWTWQINLDVLGEELADISGWPEDQLADVSPYAGPVLWVAGADSDYVREEYSGSMERWFPRHRRVSIKDAGHWVHSQQPDVLVEVIRRFVE